VIEPPRPIPLSPILALIRTLLQGDRDLLSLVPAEAYRIDIGSLGYSRRSILIVNAPELTRSILTDPLDVFPKNDLMVGALEPLVGDSMFVSSGDRWRQQRRMIDPAFSQIRIGRAFTQMTAAVDAYEAHLDGIAERNEPFSLDLAMSHLTADIITRTVFSTSLESQVAREVFGAFTEFERSVAQVQLRRLIFDPAFKKIPQVPSVLEACSDIRAQLGQLLDTHAGVVPGKFNDIASAIVEARDVESGAQFSREELIDQLGVMFLAGHETTASALTWAFYILATQPEMLRRLRAEVDEQAGTDAISFELTRQLGFVRNVFRETLRLYPPITFIPRVAAESTRIGRVKVKRGAMIMISPWVIHRHEKFWRAPHAFDPDRFSPQREHELISGTYIPFGQGPRVCVGAAFATTESTLILARLARRFDFHVEAPERVRPTARLTTRPAEQIMCRISRRRSTRTS